MSDRLTPVSYFYPRPPRGGRHDAELDEMAWELFLSTPSARRATGYLCSEQLFREISIHALREEGDFRNSRNGAGCKNFYPRPPRGGRRKNYDRIYPYVKFLSTPSARRATGKVIECSPAFKFLSTPSARRATGYQEAWAEYRIFLSTPSARRATFRTARRFPRDTYFYPRPPRGGRRRGKRKAHVPLDFYPRPPRGGRLVVVVVGSVEMLFLSTPSARRATKE